MSGLRVDVIVCTYNRERWLRRCLDSLLSHEPRPARVIVVDGPSTDGTRDLLTKLEAEGKIVLVRQEALEGISAARNLGLSASDADIVCFLDDDAVPLNGWLSAIISGYRDEGVGGVGGPVYDLDGRISLGANMMTVYGDWVEGPDARARGGLFPMMVGCNMSFRRRVLESVGGFDVYYRFHNDETDTCLRVLRSGFRIIHHEGAGVLHEACEGSYRRDTLKWYLKLRYLWGRNSAYLISKNLRDSVTFRRYAGSRLSRSVTRRLSPARGGVEADRKIPFPLPAVGIVVEIVGMLEGWSDGKRVTLSSRQ